MALQTCSSREIEITEDCEVGRQQYPLLYLLLYEWKCLLADWNNDNIASEWQGGEELTGSGTIGLLLDLDEGTLTVFKNGRRLGVMKDGLGGKYVWFVTVYSGCTISMFKVQTPN